jgi:hypothetical protein
MTDFSFKPDYQIIIYTDQISLAAVDTDYDDRWISKQREDMVHFLQIAVGMEVIITYLKNPEDGRRDLSNTQISIKGELEYSEERDRYRILINNQTYCYFTSWDVISATFDGTDETTNNHPTLIIR